MVKCSECGFLALRNRLTGGLDEAPQGYRWNAEVPTFRSAGSGFGSDIFAASEYPYTGVPICLVRAYPLHNEFANQDHADNSEIFQMLEKDRTCASRNLFTSWQQGFTPKEHREMRDREATLKYQAEREEADRVFRQSLADRAEKSQKIRFGWEVMVFGILIAIVTIAAAFIERGSLFGPGPTQPVEVTNQQKPADPPIINVPMPKFAPNIEIIIPTPSIPDTGDSPSQ